MLERAHIRLAKADGQRKASKMSAHSSSPPSYVSKKDMVPKHTNEHERYASDTTHQQQQQQTVQTQSYVRNMKHPSTRQMLHGPSVAITSLDLPIDRHYGYAQYHFVFPPCFDPVRVFRSMCDPGEKLPRHLIRLRGEKRNCVLEPIVVVRKSNQMGPGKEEDKIEADAVVVRLAGAYCDEICAIVEKTVGKEADALGKALGSVQEMQQAMNYSNERCWRWKYHRKAGTIISRHEA
ncbi:hypothetical protein LTR78_003930 [Recurvomyces mirabilis]|uniref:Uncharacterized protein n=1 Tax=Recurvomyces mirabilis TaxID=574656 RepID=A0AAE1C2Z2_9PEZI|nr:hypothetical protein LTR78_003930 [Recurvomyces mirabilis]KAK5153932.1 hypothetical protein LTS14_007152 [Recurvomyces mirabilis]